MVDYRSTSADTVVCSYHNCQHHCICLKWFSFILGMKARLMLAAISWNDLQRKRGPKEYVVRWSKRRANYVLERRTKRERTHVVPMHVSRLMEQVLEVTKGREALPPIAPPGNLKPRGGDTRKPSKEELLEERASRLY